jgi:hypothetical protein
MIEFLFASLLLASPQDADTYGRDVTLAGLCGSMGWVVDGTQANRLADVVAASHPQMTRAQFDAAAAQAGAAFGQQTRADMAAIDSQAAFQAWASALEARCDAVAQTYPDVLHRGPETAATWSATQARLAARYPQ